MNPKPYSNPYLAGVLLGLTLLASYLILGAGLGASGGLARAGAFCELAIAPARTLASSYFGAWGDQPLRYYLVFMLAGVFGGGLVSALLAGRCARGVERGARCAPRARLLFALAGGVIAGFASRLANGCTSGQALSGSAVLLTGSLLFLVSVFAGGYAAAWFVRRQWHD
jgi:uncharacterized membrane protein YedE/YeeE